MYKWYAYDLFTDERYGPYDTDIEAYTANQDKAVTVRCLRRKGKK